MVINSLLIKQAEKSHHLQRTAIVIHCLLIKEDMNCHDFPVTSIVIHILLITDVKNHDHPSLGRTWHISLPILKFYWI